MSAIIAGSTVSTTVWSSAVRKTATQTTTNASRPASVSRPSAPRRARRAAGGALGMAALAGESLVCVMNDPLRRRRLNRDGLVEIGEEEGVDGLVRVARDQLTGKLRREQPPVVLAHAERRGNGIARCVAEELLDGVARQCAAHLPAGRPVRAAIGRCGGLLQRAEQRADARLLIEDAQERAELIRGLILAGARIVPA